VRASLALISTREGETKESSSDSDGAEASEEVLEK
jgi:hypothetical protein